MELTIATINEILLPPFLFIVTFCFLCCQMYKPSKATVATATQQLTKDETTPTATQPQNEPIAIDEAQETDQEQETAPARIQDEELEADGREAPAVQESAPTHHSLEELEKTINLNKLSLRACRNIAGRLTQIDSYRLGISQKVNGADKPASQLVAEVKSRLKKDPATVAPVIVFCANPSARRRQDEALPQELEVEGKAQAS
jgi:hypothetical protein